MTGVIIGSELRAGDVLGGRFRIQSLIGIGGMGVVYRAFDQSLDIEVALKLLRPELARRPDAFASFRRELLLARQVSSPHVVRIHDISEDNGRWFISMDYISGESLEQRLDRSRALPLNEALAITHGLLDGLAAAHLKGVVHRDLKPANVLLGPDGNAYISDFGIARSLGATGLTQTGMIVGTPEYLSPEQARGQVIDARSDLYTVGLILYEMLVGELPFSGGTPAETVMQRILRPPPSLAKARPDLPRWLHAFSNSLLAINPAHRLNSAKSAMRAMDTRRVPRRPVDWRVVATSMAVALALGGAGVAIWRHPDFVSRLLAPVAVRVPRIALLPLNAPGDDVELAAVARAVDAHLRAWMRGDRALAIVPRRRILDALQRVAPDTSPDAFTHQLPEIAQAANATRLFTGSIVRAGNGQMKLELTEPDAPASKVLLELEARSVDELLEKYLQKAGAALSSQDWQPGPPPALSSEAMEPLGRALLALDAHHADAAAAQLAKTLPPPDKSALVESARLDAEEQAGHVLAAQTIRSAIITQFAATGGPVAAELYARSLAGEGQGRKASQALETSINMYPNDASLALLNAETHADSGRGEQAMDLFKAIVRNDDQDARAWYLLGRTGIQQGQPRIAVDDYLLRALVLFTRSGDMAAEAETRNALGLGYDRLGQQDAAIEQYTRAAAIREKMGDEIGLSKTLRNLAIVESVGGHHDEAQRTLDKAKAILERIGDRANLADLYNDRGIIDEERGDLPAALSSYRESLAMRRQLGNEALVAESLDNVAFSSFQLGMFDDAQVYWQQALATYEKLDDRVRMLTVEQNMGVLDLARGHFVAARERLEKTLAHAESSQLSEQTSVSLVHLAELAFLQGRYSDSIANATQAAQIAARRSDLRTETGAQLVLARVWTALGNTMHASTLLASINTDALGSEQQAAFLLVRAQEAVLASNPKRVATLLDEAATSAAKAHSGTLDQQIRLQRTRMALASGDLPKAKSLLADFGGDTGKVNEIPLRLQWLELETAAALKSENTSAAIARYRQALALLADVGDYRQASTIHELGARALPAGVEADAAHDAAKAAREQLLAQAPPEDHTSLEEQMDRRLREEAPDGNAH
ncbi:MAG: tetratricopeptide repeat protein [Dokdonella sp.]